MFRRTKRWRPRLLVGLLLAAPAVVALAPVDAQSPYRGNEPPERVESEFFERRTTPPGATSAEPAREGPGGILPLTGGELWALVAFGAACIVIGVLVRPRRGEAPDTET